MQYDTGLLNVTIRLQFADLRDFFLCVGISACLFDFLLIFGVISTSLPQGFRLFLKYCSFLANSY